MESAGGLCRAPSAHSRGVTLLDTLIGSALMLIVFVGIAGVFQLSVEVVTNNRIRAGAIALANERMEYLRSLSYIQIGVIGGIPAGNVPQEEEVSYNEVTYTRRTAVIYSDDAGDGLGSEDENGVVADYKTIRVEINWQSRQGERGLTLVGRVSPFGVETAVPGGILTISVVNEAAEPVSNAQVDIINTETSPAIDIRTYTNVDGTVTFIGASAASEYQITTSKPGHSSAQTYPVSAENPNPDPRHLTVAETLTTSATFTIDHVSTKTIETYIQVREGVWSDTMADTSKISSMSSTTVALGSAALDGVPGAYPSPGSLQSVTVEPSYLYGWKKFSAATTTPAQTSIVFHFYDGSGVALIPEGHLPGNTFGFATSSVDLSGIATTTYPALRVTSLFSSDGTDTPSIDSYEFTYDYGPEPLPDLSFSMRGEKTIGNNPSVYKYDEAHSSGSTAELVLTDIEADTYTLGVSTTTGYMLAESCEPQPEVLLPASSQTTRLYVLPESDHSLLVDVRSEEGVLLADASVLLEGPSDETRTTGSCGQTYFDDIVSGAYTLTVILPGYDPYTTDISASGAARHSAVLVAL